MHQRLALFVTILIAWAAPTGAQTGPAGPVAASPSPRVDTRTQYPPLLANSYVSVNVGYLDYPFSSRQLEAGFALGSINTPHVGVRALLFGHEFNRFLSVQAGYMRPAQFVSYRNINGAADGHHVRMGFGGASLRPQWPVTPRVSFYGEIGLGITSRAGFDVGGTPVVKDASVGSAFYGLGLDYHVNHKWDLVGGATWIPASAAKNQPRTLFVSGGFRYLLRPLPPDRVAANRDPRYIFPARQVQIEVTTGVGYGINRFVSRDVPVFWGGDARVDRGVAVHYDQNLFHSRTRFSFDTGVSASSWRSQDNRERFVTLSLYPLLRLTFLRVRAADVFAEFSMAGPTFISRSVIDGRATGHRFTFQDILGLGAFIGPSRHVRVGLQISHYSNGDLFTKNAGIMVPLTMTFGYAF